MSRWFRFYDDAVNDPKVQRLPAPLFRGWVNMLCIASKHGGRIPDTAACAFILRTSEAQVVKLIAELSKAGLIDDVPETGMQPHNWDGRQHKSDVSTERVKRFRERERERLRELDETVSRNAPEQNRAEQTKEKKEEDAPSARPPPKGSNGSGHDRYAFEEGVIRLCARDLEKWRKTFPNVSLESELTGLAKWAGEQGDWFFAVSGALAKRQREALLAIERVKAEAGKPQSIRHTKDDPFEGII